MKKLLFFILLIPCFVQAQNIWTYHDPLDTGDKLFAQDKLQHLVWGTAGTVFVSNALFALNVKDYRLKGAALAFGIGLAKEYRDMRPSPNDMLTNFAAVLLGAWISKMSCEKWLNPNWKPKRKYKVTVTNANF